MFVREDSAAVIDRVSGQCAECGILAVKQRTVWSRGPVRAVDVHQLAAVVNIVQRDVTAADTKNVSGAVFDHNRTVSMNRPQDDDVTLTFRRRDRVEIIG